MTSPKFETLFGIKKRETKDNILQIHNDLASSIQKISEEIINKIVNTAKKITGCKNLCLAGGVALNCVSNGKILRQKFFKNIWIQPASGDAGGALGCALLVWYSKLKKTREIKSNDSMKGSYLGQSFEQNFIQEELTRVGAKYKTFNDEEIISITAKKFLMERQ